MCAANEWASDCDATEPRHAQIDRQTDEQTDTWTTHFPFHNTTVFVDSQKRLQKILANVTACQTHICQRICHYFYTAVRCAPVRYYVQRF